MSESSMHYYLCLSRCSILLLSPILQTTFVTFLFLLSQVQSSLHFEFTESDIADSRDINVCNDSSPVYSPYKAIQLTSNSLDRISQNSVGRASYSQPVHLWDKTTNEITNFSTHFTLKITQIGNDSKYYSYGDGTTFFLTPFDESTACAPYNSTGGHLGLVTGNAAGDSSNFSVKDPFVAVEFDTFNNKAWDPANVDGRYDHLGIDVNSIHSNVSVPWSDGVENETTANVWITYDSSKKNLSVYLTYDADPVFNGQSNLSCLIDLSSFLPEKVRVGFSSATGKYLELHYILSWEFNSTLSVDTDTITAPSAAAGKRQESKSDSKSVMVGGLVAGVSILTIGLALVVFMWWRRRSNNNDLNFVDNEFDRETWPKRFTYNELSRATNNFSERGKLGQGGFGGVYRGFLTDLNKEIAVKKISRGSEQGIKEYMSEVKVIRCLRHKNMVQLFGWCHERGELILVYEYMPNGSLDSHLYPGKNKREGVFLPWAVRYRIAQDLASVLLYLHHEWEQCVLHRDIKSSNVMLDSQFNAKLGDFGLARLVDHNLGSQTTALAGSLGYLAPECIVTGKASKETDVYSFGVVALEIACGRRSVESKEEPSKQNIVEWVWSLYEKGQVLEAADKRLEGDFNIQEIECLLIVGLWCCHPDHTCRPCIRQAISVLDFESPFPSLPLKIPVPFYCSPQINMMGCTCYNNTPSSSGTTGTTSCSSHSAVSGGIASYLSTL